MNHNATICYAVTQGLRTPELDYNKLGKSYMLYFMLLDVTGEP